MKRKEGESSDTTLSHNERPESFTLSGLFLIYNIGVFYLHREDLYPKSIEKSLPRIDFDYQSVINSIPRKEEYREFTKDMLP